MADWALDFEWPDRSSLPFEHQAYNYYESCPGPQQPLESQAHAFTPPMQNPNRLAGFPAPSMLPMQPKGESPRELRNRAEKQRRDKLNQSISELASMVPPVVAASRKIDKTGILRLTAHFLRSHQYVFGDSVGCLSSELNSASAQALLRILNGFLLTTTYKGIVVVVSQNVQQYLGYTELELLGQNIFSYTHKDDHKALGDQLMPRTQTLGPNGELIIPDMPDGKAVVAKALAGERRAFVVRFKKHTQRSEPAQYVSCHVEGSLRKSDRACRGPNRCCQIVRRARARGENPCSSGNDVVFIGVVRPIVETFKKESHMEQFRMEYRTRHSIDGQIIQCEQRISLVTGYMTDEVQGTNAMNFMHRDDVRWVIIALREMYDQHRLVGESCYRLMTKNGQFIYMRTRGALEVDKATNAVTSFVCTNTMMSPTEGQRMIDEMKKKFTILVNNNEDPPQEPEVTDTDDGSPPVEDPKQLEKVILHLVTNLPSPQPVETDGCSSVGGDGHMHLAIIPPRKERIVRGIEKIYTIIKTISNPRIRFNRCFKRNRPLFEELPHFSGHPTLSYEADVPSPNNQIALPKMHTFAGTPHSKHTNVEDFGEIFQNLEPDLPPDKKISEVHTPGSFAEYITQQPNKQATYNFSKSSDVCEVVDLDAPSTSNSVAGIKRSLDSPPEDEQAKKKLVTSENEPEGNGPKSPIIENMLNEAILASELNQIDDALTVLENACDSFPDLLISQDVNNLLEESCSQEREDEEKEPN